MALGALLATPGIHVLVGRAHGPRLDTVDDRSVRVHHVDDRDIGVVAVRPDGYVGYADDANGLRAWLARIGIATDRG
jgi:hypothetical protein